MEGVLVKHGGAVLQKQVFKLEETAALCNICINGDFPCIFLNGGECWIVFRSENTVRITPT